MRKINNIVEENKQSCQPKSSRNQTQAAGPLYLKTSPVLTKLPLITSYQNKEKSMTQLLPLNVRSF